MVVEGEHVRKKENEEEGRKKAENCDVGKIK